MGYTHYYHVTSYYKQEEWDALLKDVKKLLLLPIPKVYACGAIGKNDDYAWYDIKNRTYKLEEKNLGELINQTKSELDSVPYYNIDEKEISFNGIGELSHEQFHIYRQMPPEVFERHEEFAKTYRVPSGINDKGGAVMLHPHFECKKTARKPYDIVVQCCLILAKKHLDKGIAVSSDGGEDEWTDAIRIIEKNFGYKVKTRWSRNEGEIFSKVN